MSVPRLLFPVALAALLVAACNGTTGDALYTFPAYAAGAKGAGEPFSVNGYTIQLTLAQMYVGAVYVNEAPPGSGGTFNSPSCIDPGIYCAQVPAGTEVNLLDGAPQPWQSPAPQGSGSADLGLSWELYLGYGSVNSPTVTGAPSDTVDLQGTATRESDGKVFTFAAIVNIESNDALPAQMAGQPGQNPICKRRILELGGISLTLFQGAQMLLTIDPRAWFSVAPPPGIDFSTLPLVSDAFGPCQNDPTNPNPDYGSAEYCIPDSTNLSGSVLGAQQGTYLYDGIFTASGAYTLAYTSAR